MPRDKSIRPTKLEPLRTSTSQPHTLASSGLRKHDWDTRSPVTENPLRPYDASHDPYCPYTRSAVFKKHIERQRHLEKLPDVNPMTKSLSRALDITMRNMERPRSAPDPEQFPKHQVPSEVHKAAGITYSVEPRGNAQEGQAELDVLKTILNREGYLARMTNAIKKVEKVFTPEVADIMDLIRVASLDVVEAIEKWRSIKGEEDAAFMWNGINYLLKMPTDLDYLSHYRAVNEWLGFTICRNPFIVPYPMEAGTQLFTGSLAQSHSDGGSDGFFIGGLSNRMKHKFAAASKALKTSSKAGAPYKSGLLDTLASPAKYSTTMQSALQGDVQSFVLNSEMVKIREAEKIILREENKYGRLGRDPDGQLMPEEQAYLVHLSLELKKDDRRSMTEKSETSYAFAPHAGKSGIGYEEQPWTRHKEEEDVPKQVTASKKNAKPPRGLERIGGELAPLSTQVGQSRTRKPLAPNIGNSIEFKNTRQKKSLSDRLAEITALKEKIAAEKAALEKSLGSTFASKMKSDTKSVTSEAPSEHSTSKQSSRRPSIASLSESVGEDIATEAPYDPVEESVRLALYKAAKESHKLQDLKDDLRAQESKERSREIERKRRLLTAEEARRKGPPAEDPPNAYDYFATKIQATIRRWLTQTWFKWYCQECHRASKMVQTRIRGWLSRLRVKMLLRRRRAAIEIQRNFRGMSTRVACAAMARDYKDGKAAIMIQKVWRRVMAKKRVAMKRRLDQAAQDAMTAVNARNLFPMDVKEIAKRIQYAINEPQNTSYPPDEVLHLLRLICLLILGDSSVGLTTLNHIGVRYFEEVEGASMTWEQTMKIVNRSNRFLRRVRAMAYAPVAKPPRLISIPHQVQTLYRAQLKNPRWQLETFETIGKGSKFCTQMFKWLTCMIDVGNAQSKFLRFIGDTFPDWLPKLFDIQKLARKAEFDICITDRCLSVINQTIEDNIDDSILVNVLSKERDALVKERKEIERKLREYNGKEEMLGSDQSSLEYTALAQMIERVAIRDAAVKEVAAEYDGLLRATEGGDALAEERLPECRERLISEQIELKEVKIQHGLLVTQIENNQHRRKERSPLSAEVLVLTNTAGEAKALYVMSRAKKAIMLAEKGLSSEDALHRHPALQQHYDDLTRIELERKAEWRAHLRTAELELIEMNTRLVDEVVRRAEAEKKESSQFVATELEMEEERLEDEMEAREERFKKYQFVSDDVLFTMPERRRPVIVAMGRDVPGHSKEKIMQEVSAQLPGLFVRLDCPKNMGLDIKAMQDVLDAKKSIIMSVDHGLTETTRSNFMKNYALVTNALVPKPYSILVIGEDGNKRTPAGDAQYGTLPKDLALLRDKDIKVSLEAINYLLEELLTQENRQRMELRANLVVPPSPAYIITLEALFIAQADHARFNQPHQNIAAITWRATQDILRDPDVLVSKLKALKRGRSTFAMCEILTKYVSHRNWPGEANVERRSDPLLHALASFVEHWTNSERLTLERGGLPDKGLFKNSMARVHSVITVSDAIDTDDIMQARKRGGWKTPVAHVLRGVLYEMSVLKTVRRIDSIMYTVNAYREAGRVFFDAYDPSTSQNYSTSISIHQIPGLLVPNKLSTNDGPVKPPVTAQEMYMRLVRLLRFQKLSKVRNGRKELLCRRENTFLQHASRKINGHSVAMKCFEAALGELYFEAYLPEYCAKLTLLIEDSMRLLMLKNSDARLEHHMMETENCVELLPYVIDRLRVTPSRPIAYSRQKRVGASALTTSHANQGFSLRLRVKGGAGRLMTKRIMSFAGVKHVLTIKCSTVSQTLRLILYEPREQKTFEVRLSEFHRKCIFGRISDDIKSWIKPLMSRIKLDWRSDHQMMIDMTIFKRVIKVAGTRLMLELSLIDDDQTKFVLFNSTTSVSYQAILTKADLIHLLHYRSIESAEQSQKSGRFSSFMGAVQNLLRYMIGTKSEASQAESAELDPSAFDIPLSDILLNKDALILISQQLETLLEVTTEYDNFKGFLCTTPVSVRFELQAAKELKPLNTYLRHTTQLKQQENDGTCLSVLRNRTQPAVIVMEDELDDLAHRKAEQAREIALANKLAAEKLQQELIAQMEAEEREYLESIAANKPASADAEEGSIPGEEVPESGAEDASIAPSVTSVDKEKDLESIGEASVPEEAEKDDEQPVDTRPPRPDVFKHAAAMTVDTIASSLEGKVAERLEERQAPGTMQKRHEERKKSRVPSITSDGSTTTSLREILIVGEKMVFDRGVKTNFREGRSRWQGHINVRVYESACWDGAEGVGRRLRFVAYEPVCAGYFEGMIRSTKHIREVLGPHGQDMLDPSKITEMLLFICRNRLEMVRNTTTWDGELVTDPNAPQYRVEFQSDRLFDASKITPVQVGGKKDEEANAPKLIDKGMSECKYDVICVEKSRGRKILRVARRVSGLLMQLVVFELPQDLETAIAKAKLERQSSKPDPITAILTEDADSSDAGEAAIEDLKKNRGRKLALHEAPSLRVVGYDPRSKHRTIIVIPAPAVTEVAGGPYSAYLEEGRRRELGRIVCDSLQLIYPRGKPFELHLPWSGATKAATGAQVGGKQSWRSSAEKVLQRPGKIFRSAIRISSLDIVVSLYTLLVKSEEQKESRKLVINFYSSAASEATEMILSEEMQIEYMGKTILSFLDGESRATAIRNLCRFFRADLVEDSNDHTKKVLQIDLMPKKKGYIDDYKNIGLPRPEDDKRSSGVPAVFMPPDTRGKLLYRQSTPLFVKELGRESDREVVVSVYSKTELAGAERGLVVRVYDQAASETVVLHYGPSEVIRLCNEADQPDILRDLVHLRELVYDGPKDALEEGFVTITEKGEVLLKIEKLTAILCNIVIRDVGMSKTSMGETCLYSKTSFYAPA